MVVGENEEEVAAGPAREVMAAGRGRVDRRESGGVRIPSPMHELEKNKQTTNRFISLESMGGSWLAMNHPDLSFFRFTANSTLLVNTKVHPIHCNRSPLVGTTLELSAIITVNFFQISSPCLATHENVHSNGLGQLSFTQPTLT